MGAAVLALLKLFNDCAATDCVEFAMAERFRIAPIGLAIPKLDEVRPAWIRPNGHVFTNLFSCVVK
jgi:hypothetical protein